MSRLRYALVGCGRRGRSHITAVENLRDLYEVVAVCDVDATAAGSAAARLGVSAYTDVRELVARERIDVCDVALPSELHHAISRYLSAHGIHQNLETPLAPTLGLMDEMIETARRHGVALQTAENFHFLPVEQFTVQLIRAGVIGPVHRCYRLFSTIWYHGLAAIRTSLAARPVAVSSLTHTMPVVPYGDAERRSYTSEGLEFYAVDYDNGSFALALVGNKNGCLGRNSLTGFETVGERGTIITNGNQGACGGEAVNVCTNDDIALRSGRAGRYEFHREHGEQGALRRIWVELPASLGGSIEWVNPYPPMAVSEPNISLVTLLEALAQAVRDGAPVVWSAESGRLDRETMIAAQRSIRANRQPVALPLAIDAAEETAFDRDFIERFGIHPREEPEKVLGVSFKAW